MKFNWFKKSDKSTSNKSNFIIISGADAAALSDKGATEVLNAAFEKINEEVKFAAKYGLQHAMIERWKVFEPMVNDLVLELRRNGYEVELTDEFIKFSWGNWDPQKPVQVNG